MNNLDRAKELRDCDKFTKEIGHIGVNNLNKQQSKQLKEKVEKGCGEQFEMGEEFPALCTKEDGIYDTWYCENCQETLKILNKILGLKE